MVVKSESFTDFIKRYNLFFLYAIGLLVTIMGFDFVYQSEWIHQFLKVTNPIGRVASILSAFLIVCFAFKGKGLLSSSTWFSPGNPYAVAGLFFFCLWFSFIPSLASWATADPYGYSIGGILQVKDANAYIAGAEQLLETGEFGEWNQRRPLNTTLLASRVVLGHHDFRNALLLQSAFFAIALFFLTFITWRQMGLLAAGLTFFLNFSFASHYLPTTLSESLGITLGMLSATFFLLALQIESRKYYYLGIFVITLALLARTGPLFVVPLFVLYAGRLFSGRKTFSLKETLIALSPVIIALIFNSSLNYFYGDDTTGPKSSLHYVLYKISVGGSKWEQAQLDYPNEKSSMSSTEFTDFVYRKSKEVFLQNPAIVVMQYLRLVFSDGVRFIYGLYGSYMYLSYPGGISTVLESTSALTQDRLPQLKVWLVSITGVFMALILSFGFFRLILHARGSSVVHLSGLAVLGTALSIPLLYSFAGVRVFITVIPFLSLFLVVAMVAVRRIERVKLVYSYGQNIDEATGSYPTAFLIILLFLGSVMPAISYELYGRRFTSDDFSDFYCPAEPGKPERMKLVMWLGPGTQHIEILEDNEMSQTFAPLIQESHFVLSDRHKRRLHDVDMVPGTVLFTGYDQLSGRHLFLVSTVDFLTGEYGYRVICAQENSEKGRFPWFVIHSRKL